MKSDRWRALLFFASAALVTLSASAQTSGKSTWALETVRAFDGHPVRESPDGALLSQTLEDCTPNRSHGPSPFAGTVSTSLRLEVELASCESGDLSPKVSCSWRSVTDSAGEATSGVATWQGAKGELAVTVPDLTGRYQFSLECTVNGEALEDESDLETTLYATFDKPLLPEPRADWYARALSWSSGHDAMAAEHDVLKSLLAGLYDYGAHHWRYGSFPDAVAASDPQAPVCTGEGADRWCACSWQGLVEEDSPCNFGSCYEFSDVFEAMAMTLGIGSFRPVVIKGATDAGIVTSPTAVSFDHRFRRNITCTSEVEGGCPAYAFSSHSLRRRGDHVYDATFDRMYPAASDAIFESIKYVPGALEPKGSLLLEKRDASLKRRGAGYGTWYFYDYVPAAPPMTPALLLHAPGEAPKPAFSNIDFEVIRDRPGGRATQVAATFDLEIFSDGLLEVNGALLRNAKVVSHKPRRRDPRLTQKFVRGAGKHSVRLLFSGEDIYHSGVDGPYELHVDVRTPLSHGPPLAWIQWMTPPYAHDDFGRSQIDSLAVRAPPRPPRPGREDLSADVSFLAREPGTFHVVARWSADGHTLQYETKSLTAETGTQSFPLRFPPVDLEQGATGGTLQLSVEFLDDDWTSDVYLDCDIALLSPDPLLCR